MPNFELKIFKFYFFFKSKSTDVCIIEERFFSLKNFFNIKKFFSEKQTNSCIQVSIKEKTVVEQEPGDPRIEWEAEA